MDKNFEQSIKSQLGQIVDNKRLEEFLADVIVLQNNIKELQEEAKLPLESTIKNCISCNKFLGNVVQYDYILKKSAKIIIDGQHRNSNLKRFQYRNAQKAQALIFNQYRFNRIDERFDDYIKVFSQKNEDVLKNIDEESLSKIFITHDQFFEDIISNCQMEEQHLSSKKVKDYLKKYDKIYNELFSNKKPNQQVYDAVGAMVQKLKGNSDFLYNYNSKTGQLTEIPEIKIDGNGSIEDADNALNYYIAYSEYFEKQKLAIGLQFASNKYFARSICSPDMSNSYTDSLKLTTQAMTDKNFTRIFDCLSPKPLDDIETIKLKSLDLEHVRSLVVSVSAFLEISKGIYLDKFRKTHTFYQKESDQSTIKGILASEFKNFYDYLRGLQLKIDKIVNISAENPVKDSNDILKQIKNLDKFVFNSLREESPELLKDYIELTQAGYNIVVPSGFDISNIKSAAAKSLILSSPKQEISLPQGSKKFKIDNKKDIALSVKEVIDAVFADTVGLYALKRDLFEYVCTLKILPQNSELRDLTFLLSGNPGSGKTMTAKKIHQVLFSSGILRQDKFYDDVAASLKARYVGQTVEKVDNLFKEYHGGTIFVDEADSLFSTGNNADDAFTSEARSKFIKLTEEDSKDTSVIMACYTQKLNDLFKSNPGIFRRFSGKHFQLPDYTSSELVEMCKLRLKIDAEKTLSQPYVFSEGAQKKLRGFFIETANDIAEEEHKENAGIVKRTLLGVLAKKAIRSNEDRTITVDDVQAFIDSEQNKSDLFNDNYNIRVVEFDIDKELS